MILKKRTIIVGKEDFLEILRSYEAELGIPILSELRAHYYVVEEEKFEVNLDGRPIPQLRKDFGAEVEWLCRKLESSNILVLIREEQLEDSLEPGRFISVAKRIIARQKIKGIVVLSLEKGVRGEVDQEILASLQGWRREYLEEYEKYRERAEETGVRGYKELSIFTFFGFGGGLGLGAVLDKLGFAASAIGEWAVRTLAGESETLAEGTWAVKSRLERKKVEESEEEELEEGGLVWVEREAAEAYGFGKVAGMTVPWIVHALYIAFALDVRGVEGSIVAYLYSLADQVGANINGLRYRIKQRGVRQGLRNYFHDPVMVSSFLIITIPLLLVYLARFSGFRPELLTLAAIEGILLNLCWAPPAVAWVWDYHMQSRLRKLGRKYAGRA